MHLGNGTFQSFDSLNHHRAKTRRLHCRNCNRERCRLNLLGRTLDQRQRTCRDEGRMTFAAAEEPTRCLLAQALSHWLAPGKLSSSFQQRKRSIKMKGIWARTQSHRTHPVRRGERRKRQDQRSSLG